jgi:hypothetical protein
MGHLDRKGIPINKFLLRHLLPVFLTELCDLLVQLGQLHGNPALNRVMVRVFMQKDQIFWQFAARQNPVNGRVLATEVSHNFLHHSTVWSHGRAVWSVEGVSWSGMYQPIWLYHQVIRAPSKFLLILIVPQDYLLTSVDTEKLMRNGCVPSQQRWVWFCRVGARYLV